MFTIYYYENDNIKVARCKFIKLQEDNLILMCNSTLKVNIKNIDRIEIEGEFDMDMIPFFLNWRGTPQPRKETNLIVLHHAEARYCTIEDVHRWHLENGWSGIGYHFLVRKDAQVFEGRPLNSIGAHCSRYNEKSIGICVEGNYLTDKMPEVQKQAVIDLLRYIDTIYPNCELKGHKELNSTLCPGLTYPLDEIKEAFKRDPEYLQAIETLVAHNMINSADYWKINTNFRPEYVRQLIINVAKKITEG